MDIGSNDRILRGGIMDYPWLTIDPTEWGLRDEDEICCLTCAEANGKALGHELTDFEINDLGGVSCQSCGRNWRPVNTDL